MMARRISVATGWPPPDPGPLARARQTVCAGNRSALPAAAPVIVARERPERAHHKVIAPLTDDVAARRRGAAKPVLAALRIPVPAVGAGATQMTIGPHPHLLAARAFPQSRVMERRARLPIGAACRDKRQRPSRPRDRLARAKP